MKESHCKIAFALKDTMTSPIQQEGHDGPELLTRNKSFSVLENLLSK
jgi:hypothetical protein